MQQRHVQHEHESNQILENQNEFNKSRKMKRYFREMVIEGLLIPCQHSITWLFERHNTPCVKWICTVSPDPVASRKKGCMVRIKTKGVEGMCIMCTARVANAIVNNHKVVGHNSCL
jgi:hypothetical protein